MRSKPDVIMSKAVLPDPVPSLSSFYRIPEAGIETRNYIGLDRNERLTPFPDWFLEKIRESVTSNLLSLYPVQDQLHSELSDYLGIAEDQIVLTPSSDAAFKALYQAYIRPGDRIVMLDPSYAMFPVYADMFEGSAVCIPYDEELQLDNELLISSIDPSVRLVILANPNQPTGTLLDPDLLIQVIQKASDAHALVAIDEAYYPFGNTTALSMLSTYRNLLIVRTFSKAYGLAGLRLGYVAGDPRVIDNISKVHTVNDLNSMSILCAMEILKHPELITDYVSDVKQSGDLLSQSARDLGLIPISTHTNFMLIRVSNSCDSEVLVKELYSQGYLVKGPFDYPCLSGCIRVTLGPPEIMEGFIKALATSLQISDIS